MLSSKTLFLSASLVCATLLYASFASARDSDTQQSANSTLAAPVLRRVVVQHLGSFDATMVEEISLRVGQITYRPRVETRYDQKKVDNVKKVLQQLWKERGVAVNVDSKLTQIRDTRYAVLEFVIYKQ